MEKFQLNQKCYINTNIESDTFVGIKCEDGDFSVHFPLGFKFSTNEKILRKEILLLINTIAGTIGHKESNVKEKTVSFDSIDFPIQACMHIIYDYYAKYNEDRSEDYHAYTDAFGIKRDLGKAKIFITESMFKAKKWIVDYLEKINQTDKDPMEFYCEMLKEYDHALYVSGTNLPYGHSKYVHLSYQTINTLKFTEEQFKRILDRHESFIKEPVAYLNSFDVSEVWDSDIQDTDEGEIDYHIPTWRRALNENNKLSEDIYIKHELKNTKKGLLTKLATGKILVEGQTRYLCRDLLPLLVSLLENPLDWFPRYLYCRFYLPTDGTDTNATELSLDFHSYYAFFRNPHLSRHEQYIMNRLCDTDEATYQGKNAYKYYKYSKELYDAYFGQLTGIVMVPRHSALPLCLGGADFDGDLVSIVYNQDVVNAVAAGAFEKQGTKYFGEVYQRKLPVIIIPTTKSRETTIQEKVPYDHIKNTFSNRIGQISDAAIAIGQQEYGHSLSNSANPESEQGKDKDVSLPSCAMCTILTGLEIDAAKNGEHPNLDAILDHSIAKASYIQFLHKFKKLRGESKYSFDDLKVEAKKSKGKEHIEVTAKNCKTKAIFGIPTTGTYINELPLAFREAFQAYKKKDIVKDSKDLGVFLYTENKEKEAEKIRDLRSKCQGIFDYYFFYAKTLMHILSNEKNEGFFAYENLETKLYQMYDEEETVRLQREVVPKLLHHFRMCVSPENVVSDMKDRMNQSQWLFAPRHKREAILEEIIGGGFSSGVLEEEEKELVFNFHNRGYIILWLVLSIIEGPKQSTFEEVMSRNIKHKMQEENKNLKLEKELLGYLKSYYEDNATETLGKIYAACLRELGGMIKQSEVSEQNKIAALYELTGKSMDNRRFFWDVFGWETLEKYLGKE